MAIKITWLYKWMFTPYARWCYAMLYLSKTLVSQHSSTYIYTYNIHQYPQVAWFCPSHLAIWTHPYCIFLRLGISPAFLDLDEANICRNLVYLCICHWKQNYGFREHFPSTNRVKQHVCVCVCVCVSFQIGYPQWSMYQIIVSHLFYLNCHFGD